MKKAVKKVIKEKSPKPKAGLKSVKQLSPKAKNKDTVTDNVSKLNVKEKKMPGIGSKKVLDFKNTKSLPKMKKPKKKKA